MEASGWSPLLQNMCSLMTVQLCAVACAYSAAQHMSAGLLYCVALPQMVPKHRAQGLATGGEPAAWRRAGLSDGQLLCLCGATAVHAAGRRRADKLQVATSRHDVCGPREACAGAAVPLSDRPGAWLATTGGGWAAGAASAAVPCVVRSRTELRNLVVGVKKPPKILRSG